ncbi:MAG: DUF2330 domain-containing protein [Phycisphaerales bacterium]|nr:DUF2330 domain-containing protein [Phycisphaerales bacterium]
MDAALRTVLRSLMAVLVVIGCAGPAFGDGCAFFVAKPMAEMPGQQALIAHENGIETLAIETRLVGEGADCAWVVPLPARPEVSPASTGVFPSLRAMCLPVIERHQSFAAPLAVLVIIGLVLMVTGGWRGIALVGFLLLLLLITLMPALGRARGAGGPVAGVSVVDRKVVGAFEVVTLDASAGDSLLAWLNESGFNVPEQARPVVEAYIQEGWCFVASKLYHEPGKETTPHPLVFRFRAEKPVYPMRLTGLQGGPLDLELYVFGPGTAKVKGMEVETTGPVKRGEYVGVGRRPYPGRDGIVLSHAGIEAIAGDTAHLTKLVGTFSPKQMAEDIQLSFGPGELSGRVAMSKDDAFWRSMDAGLLVAGCGLVLGAVVLAARRVSVKAPGARIAVMAGALVVGGATGLMMAATGPRAVAVQRWRPYRVEWYWGFYGPLWERSEAAKKAGEAVTIDWVRAEVKRILESGEIIYEDPEFPTPLPIEEDSPGNYTLREVPGGVALVPVNELGQEMNEMGAGQGMMLIELPPLPAR